MNPENSVSATLAGWETPIGVGGGLARVLRLVEMAAPTDSAVLIQGEPGTRGELVAQAIHDLGPRRQAPFVKLNCAAIPGGLLAETIGRLQAADKGTLFLDEIGELPLELQPKLLRALEDQEFEKLGSSRPIRVNIRPITATNRDLSQLVYDRHFRADLYYRLNVLPIHLPPLRERSEDIPALVHYFVRRLSRRMNKPIRSVPKDVMDVSKLHDWPGNIRELANFIERAVILNEGPVLRPPLEELEHLPPLVSTTASLTLAEAERAHARLGLPRTTLIHRMRKLGIVRSRRSRFVRGRSDTVVQFPERPARDGNGGVPHGVA